MTGSEDIAEPCMTPMIAEMKKLELFNDSNTIYRVKDGGVHTMAYVKEYLYNALPDLYSIN